MEDHEVISTLKRKQNSAIEGIDDSDCRIIVLHGKLAEEWNEQKGLLSDVAFLEQLFRFRDKYEWFKSNCQCNIEGQVQSDEERSDFIGNDVVSSVQAQARSFRRCRQVVNIEVEDEDLVEFEFYEGESIGKGKSGKLESEDSVLGQYKRACPICNQVIKQGVPKSTHILLEHFTVFANCKLCSNLKGTPKSKNANSVLLDELYNHLSSKHGTVEIRCPYCRPIQGRHTPEMDQRSLSQHILEKHSQNLMCRCNICHADVEQSKNTEDKLIKVVSMKAHISLKHTVENQKQVSCDQCGRLVAACNLQKHIKNIHMEKVHGENNLCDICGKHFVHLKQHKLSVHKGKDSWSFKCETCGKPFAKRYNLEVHSRLHTGERPYVCDICGKSFCQNVELRIHKKNNHDALKKRKRKNAKKNVTASLENSVPSHPKSPDLNGHMRRSQTGAAINQHVVSSTQPAKVDLRPMPTPNGSGNPCTVIIAYPGAVPTGTMRLISSVQASRTGLAHGIIRTSSEQGTTS